jgi:hypothetical protein
MSYEDVDWIHTAQDRDTCWAYANTVPFLEELGDHLLLKEDAGQGLLS